MISIGIWYSDNYEIYATSVLLITTVVALFNCYLTRSNLKKLRNIATYSCDVTVNRMGAEGRHFRGTFNFNFFL